VLRTDSAVFLASSLFSAVVLIF